MKRFGSVILLGAALVAACGLRTSNGVASASQAGKGFLGTSQPGATVSFIDVGQGDAALIELPNKVTVLIDGGPTAAGPALTNTLKSRGVQKIDWMIGTHPHEDHIGGLTAVLRSVPVKTALDPGFNHGTATQRAYLQLLRDKQVKLQRARAGQVIELAEQSKVTILAPREPLINGTNSDANNNSIVARFTYGTTSFLFTGDMENQERGRLLQDTTPGLLVSDVLKVAHHGSHNGTDLPFLRAVRPRYGVISLAKGNDYGHPHKEAVTALRTSGVEILRTDELGTITFKTDGSQLTLAGAPPNSAPSAINAPAKMIGNTRSKIYHSTKCEALPQAGNRVEFPSGAAAEAAGYRAHRVCVK